MEKRIAVLMAITIGHFVLSSGCQSSPCFYWEEYTDVFNAEGRVENYRIQKGRPFVIQILDLDSWTDVLRHTPEGKIDRILEQNPTWEFIFYCECPVSDSLRVMELLNRYHCHFPLILDPDRNCQHLRYGKNSHYTAVGAICDERGKSLGGSIIGTSQSFFDSDFINANREIGWRWMKKQRRK